MIAVGFFICVFPFMYPIIGRLIVVVGLFEDAEQLQQYYKIIPDLIKLVCPSIILIFVCSGKDLLNIFKDLRLNRLFFKTKDREMGADFINCVSKKENLEEFEGIKSNVREEILNFKQNNVKGSKDKILDMTKETIFAGQERENNIVKEDKKYKFSISYNVSNAYIRNILKKCKENGIEIDKFKERINNYYMKRINNMKGSKKELYINNKIKNIIDTLKYTDIIEYSDDDKMIIITEDGKEFLNNYKCREEE